ncbi:glycosyltransferase family 4 protein [Jejudonia soesokkakensis]|uniref:Glycosyltransferase family 4 protein n=1 Tax=Jejudonia soesokkakensis TaxID=1323432 RepID=A0ABW2MU89_9FLAO
MQKRKLLYIGNKLSNSGATSTYIETLSGLLQEEGYVVVSSSSEKSKVLRMLAMIRTVLQHKKTVSKVLIDTYSTQNFYYAVIIARLCRLFSIPYIPILHGGKLPDRLNKSPKLSKKLFSKAEVNVAPSRYLFEAFSKAGYENLQLIPNVISIAELPYTLRKETKLQLLWVRSFSKLYNPMLALQIIELLLQKGYTSSLTMVGPANDGTFDRCRAVSEEKNLPITFTGKLSKKEWTALSKSHDLFINTTNVDNTPLSLIEAMALGLPIVSTNVGGIPYLITHRINGLLVAPDDANLFVEAILQLYQNPTMVEALSTNGRTTAEGFDWQTIKHSWIALLDS